ncbi:MAG: 16S rRNA (cytosine(967)-C(5))-methyltransferase RsmB [Oscillospiraceae bacterium]|jgi:16S rRNA (cytosine967-C5)-methyltransferase|nr:16S rRNA (cytosine(967)-C(5))-methyltransferase RsmB [Oscillospiraceae bacterium]
MTARDAALTALREFRRGRDLRSALDAATAPLTDSRERGLAAQITLGVVRNLTLLDYYIASASSIPARKIEPLTLDILRAAVYQIAFLDKVPHSAAVSEAVSAARRKLNPRAVGYVNAVLRKLSERLPDVSADSDAEKLAVLYSHPVWLVNAIIARLGVEETTRWLAENNAEPPVYARVNTLKTTAPQLLSDLRSLGVNAEPSALDGTLELRGAGEITRLRAFKTGEFFVQDPSSARAALAVGAKAGDTIIDACAAPGGKSFALAIAMENRGKLYACDTPGRVRLIADGASRLGLTNIECVTADAAVFTARFADLADAVLADVPCSGFGVIRKKPEIRFKTDAEVAALPAEQLRILTNCSAYLKRGGALVYSTCTVLQRENEDVVAAFLAQNAGFALEEQATLWTHRGGGDSFFIAKMRKTQ